MNIESAFFDSVAGHAAGRGDPQPLLRHAALGWLPPNARTETIRCRGMGEEGTPFTRGSHPEPWMYIASARVLCS
jgi:hypothetical protein